jgi:hypothetical protein
MNRPSFFRRIWIWLRGLFGKPEPTPPPVPDQPPVPVTRKVSLLIINPTIPSAGGRKLIEIMNWNDPDRLAAEFIEDIRMVSHGYANYEIVERIEIDDFPIKEDNYRYTPDHYLHVIRTGQGAHHPDIMNYHPIIDTNRLVEKVNSGAIDEVWAMGFPWGGMYESRMMGPGAFWCNAPALKTNTPANRRFIIMGFSYERGVGEMLESYGHRTESIMEAAFRNVSESENLWKRFIRYDKTHPGQAEVGNVHFAPNSQNDYEWGSPTPVSTRCRSWANFPNLTGAPDVLDCREWGGGDIRAHHRWWLSLIPHIGGQMYFYHGMTTLSNNWWQYIVDPNLVA